MKVCLVTGGTGGHIYPAIAYAQALRAQDPLVELLFIGNKDRMESTEIPALGYNFIGLPTQAVTGSILKKVLAVLSILKARHLAKEILLKFNPDYVLGFGGYVCVPVIQAAHALKIKTFIHEQNAIAGKANLYLARFVDGVIASYPQNLKQFPRYKTQLFGNPRTYRLKMIDPAINPLVEIGIDPLQPTVLFVMGSLGAESINQKIPQLLEKLEKDHVQVIYVTGRKHYADFIQMNDETQYIKIVPYVDQLALMPHIDVFVSRGGATTAAEIMVTGCPSIIIPSPFVPNNHQYYNAKALFDAQGCLLIEEKDLTEFTLYEEITALLAQVDRQDLYHSQSLKLGHPNAAEDMIAWIHGNLSV